MPESAQKTKKKFPHWILELFTFIFIPYLIVYISSPVIFRILLFIGIPIFIFLYFRLTNYIINLENPAERKKLILPQVPKSEGKRAKNHFLKRFSLTVLILIIMTQIFLLLGNINNYRETIINLPDNFSFSIKSQELSKIQSLQNIIFMQMLGVIFLIFLIAWFFRECIKLTLQNHILRVFVATVISGGILAFAIPSFLYNYRLIGETKDLTTALLGVTGGVVALFSLIKSHQKSELEREQLEVQKQKDNRDHIRQVHAARRDRYIEAVDKLSSKNASVRLGGVYALAGLADEWLDDNNIDRKTRVKEGQVIINNLCSYIRSPFPLAEKIDEYKAYKKFEEVMQKDSKRILEELDFPDWIVLNDRSPSLQNYKKPKNIAKDYAMFSEEQDVRRAIFDEMSKRSSTFTKNENGEIIETISGMWSDFDFDFSRAPVFYSLGDLTIEKGNFSAAKFYFYAGAHFDSATFIEKADFWGVTFIDRAYFANVTFIRGVDFSWAEFGHASFYTAKFIGKSSFTNANFSEAIFFGAKFTENAIFCRTTFTNYADFLSTTFTGSVNFSGAVFDRTAVFAGTTFTSAVDFSGATFTLSEMHFTGILNPEIEVKAQFSAAVNPQDYNFAAAPVGIATLLGETFEIPLETVLFDPMSPKYKDGNYSGLSEPAKPIEESDNQGKTPSK